MAREVVSGFVREIRHINTDFSLVTLIPLADGRGKERTVRVYMPVGEGYLGRVVDIVNEFEFGHSGVLELHQSIDSWDRLNSTRKSHSQIMLINEAYQRMVQDNTS